MPSEQHPESCFTCLHQTDHFRRIVTEQDGGESVEAIFARHFWFTKSEYQDRIVCLSCWKKINEFHKFYCEVQWVHRPEELVKNEPEEELIEDEVGANNLITDISIEPTSKFETENDDLEDDEDDVRTFSSRKSSDKEEKDISLPNRGTQKNKRKKLGQFMMKKHHCEKCDKYFPTARTLEKHNSSHLNGVEPAKTVESSSKKPENKFSKEDELIRQFVTLSCSGCDFVGETFNKLMKHISQEHKLSNKSVMCCGRWYSDRQRLVEHCWRHANPHGFKCDTCGKHFKNSRSLQTHNWYYHRSIQPNVHAATRKWVCDICSRTFSYSVHFDRHRLTDCFRRQCETCLKWLSTKSYHRHRQICGNNAEPAKCDQCEHVSLNRPALAMHKRNNHSAKHRCRYCGKEFKREVRKTEHEAGHKGLLLYRCPYCPRACNSSSNMYMHKKKAHPVEWAEAKAARFSKGS